MSVIGVTSNIEEQFKAIEQLCDRIWDLSQSLTEEQYRRIYYIRGISMNLKAIVREVQKGLPNSFVSMGYFAEKIESLKSDLSGFSKLGE